MTERAAQPGDSIVFERRDGRFDVLRITEYGARDVIRMGLTDIHNAYAIAAIVSLERGDGKVWIGYHGDPLSLESYES